MTATSIVEMGTRARRTRAALEPAYRLNPIFWGYAIRPREQISLGLLAGQSLAWALGIGLLAASAWFQLMPQQQELQGFSTALSALCLPVALLLIWFASRGTTLEVQFDTAQGEVREVLLNKAGRQSLIGRHGFDAISGVHIQRQAGQPDRSRLILRFRNSARSLTVATGPEAELLALRDRLGRDLLVPLRNPVRAV